MKLLDILAGIIAILITGVLVFVLGRAIGGGAVSAFQYFTNRPSSLDRRILYLEEKVSLLEDRMDRAALGLSNRVYQPSRILFHLGDDTNTVVLSNIFTNYYTQEQLDRLLHADDKRFDK